MACLGYATAWMMDAIKASTITPFMSKVSHTSDLGAATPFQACRLALKQPGQGHTVVKCKGLSIGGDSLTVMAGPCSIESPEQIYAIAASVKQAGAHILRGGAVKPRTSPYDFQGLGADAWQYMAQAAREHQLLTVSEVMHDSQLPVASDYIDIIQVGARNMQNTALLSALGQSKHPVLLKRNQSATYQEWLLAAEYILARGNPNVILCERGIRSFEPATRNTLDLAAVPMIKHWSHLPIIIDPSHGTGLRYAVPSMARAAVAAGADGVMLEVHTQPDQSVSDARQSISTAHFAQLMPALQSLNVALMV